MQFVLPDAVSLKGVDMMPPTVDLGRQIPVPPPGIQHVVPALGGEWHVQLRYGQTTVNDQPPVHGLTTRRGARRCRSLRPGGRGRRSVDPARHPAHNPGRHGSGQSLSGHPGRKQRFASRHTPCCRQGSHHVVHPSIAPQKPPGCCGLSTARGANGPTTTRRGRRCRCGGGYRGCRSAPRLRTRAAALRPGLGPPR